MITRGRSRACHERKLASDTKDLANARVDVQIDMRNLI
jgi:hypothetical protein